jgi:hypothetical protein
MGAIIGWVAGGVGRLCNAVADVYAYPGSTWFGCAVPRARDNRFHEPTTTEEPVTV